MKKIAGILILTLMVGCSTPEHKENWKKAAAVGVVALALVAIAKGGGGSGGGQNYGANTVDTGWAWDGFYSNGLYQWACRGVQTGRFAEEWHCAGQTKVDSYWPG